MARRRTRARKGPTLGERLDRLRRQTFARAGGAAMIVLGVWLFLAVATFSISDPSLDNATPRAVENWAGPLGAVTADILLQFIGAASLLIAPPLIIWGYVAFARGADIIPDEKTPLEAALRMALGPLSLILLAGAASIAPTPASWPFVTNAGGVFGDALSGFFLSLSGSIAPIAAAIITGAAFGVVGFAAYFYACGLTVGRVEDAYDAVDLFVRRVRRFAIARYDAVTRQDIHHEREEEEFSPADLEGDLMAEDREPPLVALGDGPGGQPQHHPQGQRRSANARRARRRANSPSSSLTPGCRRSIFSPSRERKPRASFPMKRSTRTARMLENVLADFGVKGRSSCATGPGRHALT
ncbi:MAG: DNA translocase FtsK 4TM domain-containing protein [Parvularculaceae bacterium]